MDEGSGEGPGLRQVSAQRDAVTLTRGRRVVSKYHDFMLITFQRFTSDIIALFT